MKKLTQCLLLALLHANLGAAEALIVGGKSPDGRFEVVLEDGGTGYPAALIRNTQSKSILSDSIGGGYGNSVQVLSEEFNSKAAWSPDSTKVLIKTRGTKWSTNLALLQLRNGKFVEAELPDFYPAVLKDIGVASIYRRAFTSPLRWSDNSTVMLKLEGDCDLPSLKPEESRRWFEYEVTVDLAGKTKPVIKRLALKEHNG